MAQPVLKFANGVTVKDGVITAILSTEAVDRDGDVVTLEGWDLANFAKAPRLMSCHDYSSLTKQIGEWRNVRVDKERGALIGEPHYYTGQGNPEADWAYFLATQGQATFSVGFSPTEFEPRKGAGMVYTRKELLECSHVPIPANQEAVQLMAKALASRQPTPGVQKAEMGGDEQTCVQMAQGILDQLNQLILHEAQEQVDGEDEDDDIRLLLTCRDMIQQFQRNEMLGDGGDYGYGMGYAYMGIGAHLLKAGRTISAANMNQLHTALDSLHAVHDGACKDPDCAYNDDGDELPPTERDKSVKAAGEGSGSAGGATVSDSGTHGAFDGKHSHAHDAAGHASSADDDGMHEHSHSHDGDGNHGHAHPDSTNFKTLREREITRAEQSTATQNDLPDDAFAVISAGGKKDDEGKTTPRSLRHLPHHKADGSIDLPHLKELHKNALARVSQTDLSAEDRKTAEAHLQAHAKKEGIGDYADKEATQGHDPQAFRTAVEKQLTEALEAVEW